MLRFSHEPLPVILPRVAEAVRALAPGESFQFEVPDPDLSVQHYPGELTTHGDAAAVYRPLAAWLDLAEALDCALGTPQPVGDGAGFIRLRLRKLDVSASWQAGALPSGHPERYGEGAEFNRVHKLEEPRFLVDYLAAVETMALPDGARVLALGVNHGAELGILASLYDSERLARMRLVGVDHARSAISAATKRYQSPCFRFIEGDLSDLQSLDLGRFDLVIALNTLQSPAFDGRAVFRAVLAHHLRPGGGLILGFPNCRYVDHTLLYGAQRKGISGTELSVLLKEVKYYKRVLHQRGFDVTLTGKYTLLLCGRGGRSRA